MASIPPVHFSHLGIHVFDIEAMSDFYTRVMGLVVTDGGPYYRGGEIRFLSGSDTDHHQIVLASGRAPGSPSLINQISFKVADLNALKQAYDVLSEAEVEALAPRDHGNAWSIYFLDPEGNRIELYVNAPWYVRQPDFGRDLDMSRSAEAIFQHTRALAEADPTFMPIGDWSALIRQKLDQRPS